MIVVQDQDDLPGEAIHQLVGEGIQGGEAPGFMEPLGRGATQPGVQGAERVDPVGEEALGVAIGFRQAIPEVGPGAVMERLGHGGALAVTRLGLHHHHGGLQGLPKAGLHPGTAHPDGPGARRDQPAVRDPIF
jgi:hypothetical protein